MRRWSFFRDPPAAPMPADTSLGNPRALALRRRADEQADEWSAAHQAWLAAGRPVVADPEPPRCSTCRHWREPINDLGTCNRFYDDVPHESALYISGAAHVELQTLAIHGCTEHAPRPPTEETEP